MSFDLSANLKRERTVFEDFLKEEVSAKAEGWYRNGSFPKAFFRMLGEGGWFGFSAEGPTVNKASALREAVITEALAKVSPGLAVAALAHIDLGVMALYLYGTEEQKRKHAREALAGKKVMCIGNTENIAGSDVAGIGMSAEKVDGGWQLNGAKAYVTNGNVADLAVVTAVTDPQALRSQRLSMFLVDLSLPGIERTKLNKQVWIPSDLTRLKFKDVTIPEDGLMGRRGQGLQQVLDIFTHSRVSISALTLGTAAGAFELGLRRAGQRSIFGKKLAQYQAKAFEMADLYAQMEASRLVIYRACEKMDAGLDFKLEASMAKYLAVNIARKVTTWAADLFGAASVVYEHPIHKYPMDTWGASLGEGTQDVQKLVIFREMMKRKA